MTATKQLHLLNLCMSQVVVLYVVRHSAALYYYSSLNFAQIIAMAVIIFGFWNVPVVRNCINPLKLFTYVGYFVASRHMTICNPLHRIGWHELCHIAAVRPLRDFLHVLVAETP